MFIFLLGSSIFCLLSFGPKDLFSINLYISGKDHLKLELSSSVLPNIRTIAHYSVELFRSDRVFLPSQRN
jgi:hypothetical protein